MAGRLLAGLAGALLAPGAGGLLAREDDAPGTFPECVKWGLWIDGKDADRGASVFRDSGFDGNLTKAYERFVLGPPEPQGLAPLSPELLEEIHASCCGKYGLRDWTYGAPMTTWAWANGLTGGEDYLPECMDHLRSCEYKVEMLRDLPSEVVEVRRHNATCVRQILTRIMFQPEQARNAMNAAVETYNADLNGGLDGSLALARFVRTLGWLHPYTDGNGRFRTLLMQREIRRLGLGSGAFMYNYNRDIYFTHSAAYAEKLLEGIRMAELARRQGKNPWLEKKYVVEHMMRFKPPPGLEKCPQGKKWGTVLNAMAPARLGLA